MALEDSVVLAQCIDKAPTLQVAFEVFMARRLPRVRTVVETSVALSHLEQINAPPAENRALMKTAFEAIRIQEKPDRQSLDYSGSSTT